MPPELKLKHNDSSTTSSAIFRHFVEAVCYYIVDQNTEFLIKMYLYISWRREWQSTPALLPGKSHGQRSLIGYSPWGRKESDTTERVHFHFHLVQFTLFLSFQVMEIPFITKFSNMCRKNSKIKPSVRITQPPDSQHEGHVLARHLVPCSLDLNIHALFQSEPSLTSEHFNTSCLRAEDSLSSE